MAIATGTRRRYSLRLRGKILAVCLSLVLFPALIAWLGGLYERWVCHSIPSELERITTRLARELPPSADQGAWLSTFARKHQVFIRIIDARGAVRIATDPLHGEGRVVSQRGFFSHVADFFYGPAGAPDILAFEKSLDPIAEREEVRAALQGNARDAFREPTSAKMLVFYRAVPASNGQGAIYVARASRRTMRALYDLRYQLLQLTLLLLLVASAMGSWMAWHVVRPLSRMQQGIHRYLTTGKAASIAMSRKDEIGDLSRDFDELVTRLHDRLTQTSRSTADLAHDLKSPLSTVAASAELLGSSDGLGAERRERIAKALAAAAAHMSTSVQAMLELARLDESLSAEERRPRRVADLVARLIDDYRRDPRNERIRFVTEAATEATVLAAEERLAQALRNLLDNAVSFCRQTVLVRTTVRDTDVIIDVMDDGPGVSPGNRDKIFTRFFSVRPDDRAAGSGLGLAIVQTVAEAHGGRVELAEESQLGGACFRLVLPVLSA